MLDGLQVYRPHDYTELLAIVNQLPAYLKVKPKVRLVIIDSVAFHFRQNLQASRVSSELSGVSGVSGVTGMSE